MNVKPRMHRLLLLSVVILHASSVLGLPADTNAPAFRFHPELAEMTNRFATTMVLTNSALSGMPFLQVSNHFCKTGFYLKTNSVAVADTGYRTSHDIPTTYGRDDSFLPSRVAL